MQRVRQLLFAFVAICAAFAYASPAQDRELHPVMTDGYWEYRYLDGSLAFAGRFREASEIFEPLNCDDERK